MDVHKELWAISGRRVCPDCFHDECLEIDETTTKLIQLLQEADRKRR